MAQPGTLRGATGSVSRLAAWGEAALAVVEAAWVARAAGGAVWRAVRAEHPAADPTE